MLEKINELEHAINDLENELEYATKEFNVLERTCSELEDSLNESENDKWYLEEEVSELRNQIENLEEDLKFGNSPTQGFSISQVSCYNVFMEILETLPVSAHEIEEKLIDLYGK